MSNNIEKIDVKEVAEKSGIAQNLPLIKAVIKDVGGFIIALIILAVYSFTNMYPNIKLFNAALSFVTSLKDLESIIPLLSKFIKESQTAFMPLLTLVFGFYFGSKQKK